MTEQDRARNILFQELTRVSHRDYGPGVLAFREALEADPDFTARACVHLNMGGSQIRDQQDVGIITLLQAPSHYGFYREAGRCLLLGQDVYTIQPRGVIGLPPFRIFRVESWIRGEESRHRVPRLMKSCLTDYVRMLESDPLRFDGVVLRNRKALKSIYINYHISPDPRAQAILFDNAPPPDSKLAILKTIAHSTDIREQVRLVMQHRIPYTVASSVLPKITPAVGVALIDVMSPTEALNSRAWVERAGLLQISEVRDAYTAKVADATASIASADHRKSAKGQDAQVQAAVEEAKEKAVKKSQRIQRRTLLLVDKSLSMERALRVAQELGARIGPLCDDLMVVVFNDYAQEIKVGGANLADWQRGFLGVRAGGATAPGAGLKYAIDRGFYPEQVVIITDGGENRQPLYARLMMATDQSIHTIMIRLPGDPDVLSSTIQGAGLRLDRFETDGSDYYVYDQVISLLGGPPAQSLVEQILDIELPRRIDVSAQHC